MAILVVETVKFEIRREMLAVFSNQLFDDLGSVSSLLTISATAIWKSSATSDPCARQSHPTSSDELIVRQRGRHARRIPRHRPVRDHQDNPLDAEVEAGPGAE